MNYLKPLLYALLLLAGCASTPNVVPDKSQLELRQMQTRSYDSLSRNQTLRSVIATLQDLGFVVDAADPNLGVVTGTRFDTLRMRMTVTVREKDGAQISVRANARIDEFPIDNAATYQDFFSALDKAVFLTANNVD